MKRTIMLWILAILVIGIIGGCEQVQPKPAATPDVQMPLASAQQSASPTQEAPTDTPAPAPSPDQWTAAYIAADNVRIRALPSTDSDTVIRVAKGIEVERLSEQEGWNRVRCGDFEGYIKSDLLSDTKTEPYAPESLDSPEIVVKKALRRLELWDGSLLVGCWPVGLGWEPVGHKQEEGDGRTPEGEYYVCMRNGNSRYYLSLGVSYPNKTDARAALDAGKISRGLAPAVEHTAGRRDHDTRPRLPLRLDGGMRRSGKRRDGYSLEILPNRHADYH